MPCCNCKNFYKTTHEWMASLFGVFLKEDIMPKITDSANFLDWSWWFWITPNLKGTILARPRFHLTIFGYLLISNLVFWNEYFADYEFIDDDNESARGYVSAWSGRLMVFVLAGYMFHLVTAYWIGTRLKCAQLLIGTSKVVDLLTVTIDYENPRAEEFLRDLWGAIHLIGHYAFAISSKNTKYRLSEKEVTVMFEEHGYEAEPLLKLHVKHTINTLHWGILQSIKKERMSGGCMESMHPDEHVHLLESMAEMSGGAMSVMSCTSSNKLPFALFHLVNWVTRLMLFFYLVTVYGAIAKEIKTLDASHDGVITPPLTCIGGSVDPNLPDERYCPTRFYIYFNVFYALTLYFVLGCLEMQYVLSKIWESGLVLANYKGVIDKLCAHILSKPKDLSELKVKKVVEGVKAETSKHTSDSQKTVDLSVINE